MLGREMGDAPKDGRVADMVMAVYDRPQRRGVEKGLVSDLLNAGVEVGTGESRQGAGLTLSGHF